MQKILYDVDGVPAVGWARGEGSPLLLLHGSGPGAGSAGAWARVIDGLAARFQVFTTDLIGFGESGHRPHGPFFDMAMWQRQAETFLARLPGESIGVVGHSISGPIALRLAAKHRRVTRVMTTATMGHPFTKTDATPLCWTFPETRDDLRRTLQLLMHDHSVITEQMLDARMAVLNDESYRTYFSAMFAGDAQQYIDAASLNDDEFAAITCPVTMIHGRNDVMFPVEGTTIPISQKLPQADVHLIANCSHLPAVEHPQKVLSAMIELFA